MSGQGQVRFGGPPAGASVNQGGNPTIPPIDMTKSYSSGRIINAAAAGGMSYIVQLQPAASLTSRNAHMKKIQDLCDVVRAGAPPSDLVPVGIEAQLETTMVGYVGVFSEKVVEIIKRDIVS